jgi:hypothetical protein
MTHRWAAGALALVLAAGAANAGAIVMVAESGVAGEEAAAKEGEPAVTEAEIRALLVKWRARGEAAAAEVGLALSRAFLSTPDAFLNAMSHDSKSWFSWLGSLPQHTFTVDRAADLAERELLLKKMLAAARSYPRGKSLVTMARQLEERLEQAQVRQVE